MNSRNIACNDTAAEETRTKVAAMETQVELVGGPFDGGCHELNFGFPPPDKLALKIRDSGERAWYERREDGKYQFVGFTT